MINSQSPNVAGFYSDDPAEKAKLVEEVKNCCLHNGFFQIVGHHVPAHLQSHIFNCSKKFFDQPLEEKRKVSKGEFDLTVLGQAI